MNVVIRCRAQRSHPPTTSRSIARNPGIPEDNLPLRGCPCSHGGRTGGDGCRHVERAHATCADAGLADEGSGRGRGPAARSGLGQQCWLGGCQGAYPGSEEDLKVRTRTTSETQARRICGLHRAVALDVAVATTQFHQPWCPCHRPKAVSQAVGVEDRNISIVRVVVHAGT